MNIHRNSYNKFVKGAHVNIRSLLPVFDDITRFIINNEYDIFAITETWLKSTTPTASISINGYDIFRRDKQTRGGGIVIFVKTTLKCKMIIFSNNNNFNSPSNIEQLWITCKFSNKTFALGCIYRLPAGILDKAINILDNVLPNLVIWRNKTDVNWRKYTSMRNFALSSIRREKKAYYSFLFKHENASRFYKKLSAMGLSNKKPIDIPCELKDSTNINNYFCQFLRTILLIV